MKSFINTFKSDAAVQIASALKETTSLLRKTYHEIIFLCIGSDRIIGDCLGPLSGQIIYSHHPERCFVYGTVIEPVHACNLQNTIKCMEKEHPQALTIAIDAALGEKKHLGYASIANGALYPGAGVQKNLPPVGDLHITGIINTISTSDYLSLQTTRLSFVLSVADTIAQGILTALPVLTDPNNLNKRRFFLTTPLCLPAHVKE